MPKRPKLFLLISLLLLPLFNICQAHADDAIARKAFGDLVIKLTSGSSADNFGSRLTLSGSVALVSAMQDHEEAIASGAVYVFEKDQNGGGQWGLVAKLKAADAGEFDSFGFTLALNGTIALIGGGGATYVFERDHGGAGNWGQAKKITVTGHTLGGVALSGTTALIGARRRDDADLISRAAFVFERDHGGVGNWGQVAKLTAADAATGFSGPVALHGTTALVAATSDDDGGARSGSVYVFERDHGGVGNWGQVAKLTASDAEAGHRFGSSISLNSTTALAGTTVADSFSGSVYVFERDHGGDENWGQVAKLTAPDAAPNDFFGHSTSLHGTMAVIGVPGDDEAGVDVMGYGAGSVYIFERDQGGFQNWGYRTKLFAPDAEAGDFFGSVADPSGTLVLVGAPLDGTGSSGSAYFIDLDFSAGAIFEDGFESGGLLAWHASTLADRGRAD